MSWLQGTIAAVLLQNDVSGACLRPPQQEADLWQALCLVGGRGAACSTSGTLRASRCPEELCPQRGWTEQGGWETPERASYQRFALWIQWLQEFAPI